MLNENPFLRQTVNKNQNNESPWESVRIRKKKYNPPPNQSNINPNININPPQEKSFQQVTPHVAIGAGPILGDANEFLELIKDVLKKNSIQFPNQIDLYPGGFWIMLMDDFESRKKLLQMNGTNNIIFSGIDLRFGAQIADTLLPILPMRIHDNILDLSDFPLFFQF